MKTLILATLTTLWTVLCSCEHQQDLCFDHNLNERRPVEVIFDWSECPEANPATMSLYLFPADKSHYTRHEFSSRDGGKILIAPGLYTAIALNSDNESVRVINSGFADDFTIALRDNASNTGSSPIKNSTKICQAPDSLWVAYIPNLQITGNQLMVPMNDACCHYSIEIRHLTNSNLIWTIDGTLGGMTGMKGFPSNPDSDVQLHFSMKVNDDGGASGMFLTFGHCGHSRVETDEEPEPIHKLGLYFTLGDGSVRYCSRDVTDDIHSQPIERCHIVIDSLAVPINPSGGMSFTVADWNIVYKDVSAN